MEKLERNSRYVSEIKQGVEVEKRPSSDDNNYKEKREKWKEERFNGWKNICMYVKCEEYRLCQNYFCGT